MYYYKYKYIFIYIIYTININDIYLYIIIYNNSLCIYKKRVLRCYEADTAEGTREDGVCVCPIK